MPNSYVVIFCCRVCKDESRAAAGWLERRLAIPMPRDAKTASALLDANRGRLDTMCFRCGGFDFDLRCASVPNPLTVRNKSAGTNKAPDTSRKAVSGDVPSHATTQGRAHSEPIMNSALKAL